MVWYGMVEVCEGAPVAVSGWVLTVGLKVQHMGQVLAILSFSH